ncbi:HAD family hydrolase [Humibacter antri]
MALAAFDLDGTLVDQARAAREWSEELIAQWCLPLDAAEGIASALSERGPKDAAFDRLVAARSLPLRGADLLAAYRRRMPDLVQCTDADKAALRGLRAEGWTIGVLTNGSVQNQEGKIRATGLAALVDGWVISEEAGFRKPDPAIFRALAERLGCSLRGWMVGDSLEHDVAGGAAVGLRTAWITSAGVPTTSAGVPTITARTVTDAVFAMLEADPR